LIIQHDDDTNAADDADDDDANTSSDERAAKFGGSSIQLPHTYSTHTPAPGPAFAIEMSPLFAKLLASGNMMGLLPRGCPPLTGIGSEARKRCGGEVAEAIRKQ
jgi:hypothetical protein